MKNLREIYSKARKSSLTFANWPTNDHSYLSISKEISFCSVSFWNHAVQRERSSAIYKYSEASTKVRIYFTEKASAKERHDYNIYTFY